MKEQTKECLMKGIKAVPFGVAIGITGGLLFGFGIGLIVTGLTTLAICEYTLTKIEEPKTINS
jgi:hypothetical protein